MKVLPNITLKLSEEQVKAAFYRLNEFINNEPDDRTEALELLILQNLWKKMRTKVEGGKKNITFKPEEALAFFNYFGITADHSSHANNTVNMINMKLDRILP